MLKPAAALVFLLAIPILTSYVARLETKNDINQANNVSIKEVVKKANIKVKYNICNREDCNCEVEVRYPKALNSGYNSASIGEVNRMLENYALSINQLYLDNCGVADPKINVTDNIVGPGKYTLSYDIKHLESNILSVLFSDIRFPCCHAHPDDRKRSFNFNLKSGQRLFFMDVIKADKIKEVNNYVYKELISQGVVNEKAGAKGNKLSRGMPVFDFKDKFYFKDGNIVVYFERYELGPRPLGSVEIKLPIEFVKENL